MLKKSALHSNIMYLNMCAEKNLLNQLLSHGNMVLTSDGNSEIGAHVKSNISKLIAVRYLSRHQTQI